MEVSESKTLFFSYLVFMALLLTFYVAFEAF